MNRDLERTKEMLISGEYTCVLCKGTTIHTSTETGIVPLIKFLDLGQSYDGFSATD